MKEFISKWSNWWILNSKRKQLDEAFEKELSQLIEREAALRIHDVVGRSEQLSCPRCRHTGIDTDKDGLSYCRGCSHYWRAT